jgi:hypothetical protein
MLLKILKSKKTASRTLIAVGGATCRNVRYQPIKHIRESGSACRNIEGKKPPEVGHHARISPAKKRSPFSRRWVNMQE